MTITIYNTLTQQKEPLTTVNPNEVTLYVCGMTVYDHCHIGHGRVLANFDVIARYFRYLGYNVNYVRNITDIDDKILNKAQANHEDWRALSQRFIQAMHEDLQALFIEPPTEEPKATDYIDAMQAMIQTLIDQGYAYQGANGDIYYQVDRFQDYGALAHQSIDTLRSGARVAVEQAKRDPLDFVLWKQSKPGEPSWPSPWGAGRPGWHIECSAMSVDRLGETFDIHGGGQDLRFPHHQNEIAQSQSATDGRFARYWVHVGYVEINKEKMSKSSGNFFTIREVLKQYDAEVLRYFMINPHYRSPINYTLVNLDKASHGLERLYIALRHLPVAEAPEGHDYERQFNEAMRDDFNTPMAFKVLFDMARAINRCQKRGDEQQAAQLGALMKKLGGVLGLLQRDPDEFLHGALGEAAVQRIEALIQARAQARRAKDYPKADALRDQLESEGITLEDTPQGTIWRRVIESDSTEQH